jgi:UDP-glucose:(heptosyl)LPS alpha-1,3-glucosyltransferase
LGIPEDAHVLLFVGSLIRRKGCDLILEAMKRSSSSAWCLIVGEGPELESLRAQAKSLGLNPRVIFHPYVKYAQLPEFWAAADAMILPSRFDAWPVVVVESLVAGLPVVGSTACGSVRDCINDRKTGWMFRTEDVAALAECLVEFERTPREQLRSMGELAQRTMERYSPNAVARQFGTILEELTPATP